MEKMGRMVADQLFGEGQRPGGQGHTVYAPMRVSLLVSESQARSRAS